MSDTKQESKEERMVVEYKAGRVGIKLNPTIVKRYLVNGKADMVTDSEVVMFMQLCRAQGLNPFLRDAYLIKYSSSSPATIVTGKDTFLKRAASIPECMGYNAGVIVRRKIEGGKRETIQRVGAVVFDEEELIGGWAQAYRKGWQEAVRIEVSLKEYMRYDRAGELTPSWKIMRATMIRKVALVQVLREAFPDYYGGMYSPEEMPIDDSQLPREPVKIPDAEVIRSTQESPSGGNGDEKPATPQEPAEDKPAENGQGQPEIF